MKKLCLLLALLLAGCASAHPAARLSQKEVIDLAKTTARSQGIDLARYDRPSVRYQQAEGGGEWFVYFAARGIPKPGGYFAVVVEDTSKSARYIEGR